MNLTHKNFTAPLLNWSDRFGRHTLPWQHPRSAYRVWLSEIMLQQTTVKTVVPYFMRFVDRFPDVHALASAREDEVLALWSGLGYYRRARFMHKTAQIIAHDFNGEFPQQVEDLQKLPGIGPSTAAAIASLAFNLPEAILDGNVKRVLSRYFRVDGLPSRASVTHKLLHLAQTCMPKQQCTQYTQAIMDLGATCCTPKNPRCAECPVHTTCAAFADDVVLDYPHKAAKRILPVREQQFLVLYQKPHLIYLEKNPPTGLWGGLWCLPAISKDECAQDHIQKKYCLHAIQSKPLLHFRHTFSHFHLEIHALTIETYPVLDAVAERAGQWFESHQLDDLGLATPTRRILDAFYSD